VCLQSEDTQTDETNCSTRDLCNIPMTVVDYDVTWFGNPSLIFRITYTKHQVLLIKADQWTLDSFVVYTLHYLHIILYYNIRWPFIIKKNIAAGSPVEIDGYYRMAFTPANDPETFYELVLGTHTFQKRIRIVDSKIKKRKTKIKQQ